MTHKTHAYTFELNGEHIGSHVVTTSAVLISHVTKLVLNGAHVESRIQIALDEGRITAFRTGDGEWMTMAGFPEDSYPSSAYPILLSRLDGRMRYQRIDEPSGAVVGWAEIESRKTEIRELHDGVLARVFVIEGDDIIFMEWGEAELTLVDSIEEAEVTSH